MTMFKAIVLDLFDTLVNWDPDGLPVMHWKGRDIHSTVPWILPKVAGSAGQEIRPRSLHDRLYRGVRGN